MQATANVEGEKANIKVEGKLTVQTSPDLSAVVDGLPASVKELEIDLTSVDYAASAGLRVLVATEKLMVRRGGSMVLRHPSDSVMEVFEMTGLSTVFTIER